MSLEEFRRKRSARKRDDILHAALKRFRTDGYARAPMEAIAADAGVSTATLYRHFRSKEVLFEAIAKQSLEGLVSLAQKQEADGLSQLRALAREYAARLAEPETRGMVRMLIAEVGGGGALSELFYESIKKTVAGAFAGAVLKCVEDGTIFIEDPPEAVAGQLQGMIEHGTLLQGLVRGDEIVPMRATDEIANEALKTWLARWGVK